MNYKNNVFEDAKRLVSMRELLNYHGVQIRDKRCRCFIHGGHDFNMSVNETYCHCFVCGENADIFKAQMLLGGEGSPLEACKRINEIFGLKLEFHNAKNAQKKFEKSPKIPYKKYNQNKIPFERSADRFGYFKGYGLRRVFMAIKLGALN